MKIYTVVYITVNSRYNQVGYNEITAYNEMEIFPQSTKCINYYPLITNIGYNEGIYRSQALRYNESSLYNDCIV